MGWAETRAAARDTVHATFGLSASYLAPGGGPLTSGISVRWHTKTMRHGELDREGYPQVQEDINRIVLDILEVPDPQRNALVTLSDGRIYAIEYVMPFDGRYAPCDVVRVPA